MKNVAVSQKHTVLIAVLFVMAVLSIPSTTHAQWDDTSWDTGSWGNDPGYTDTSWDTGSYNGYADTSWDTGSWGYPNNYTDTSWDTGSWGYPNNYTDGYPNNYVDAYSNNYVDAYPNNYVDCGYGCDTSTPLYSYDTGYSSSPIYDSGCGSSCYGGGYGGGYGGSSACSTCYGGSNYRPITVTAPRINYSTPSYSYPQTYAPHTTVTAPPVTYNTGAPQQQQQQQTSAGPINIVNNNNNTNTNTNTAPVTPVYQTPPQYVVQYVAPQPTPIYYPPPVHTNPAPYVALSQIPYTGFDFGPVGNAIYWLSLLSFAVAAAYLLVYYRGGMMAFATGRKSVKRYAPARPLAFAPVKREGGNESEESPLERGNTSNTILSQLPIAENRSATHDSMTIARAQGEMPRIVITRN